MKNWSILICKSIVLIFLLALADFGIGKLFVQAKDYALASHPEDMWLKSSYAVEKVHSDIIIIGSSTAVHHYIPTLIKEKTNLSTYNCGQDGCFFLYNACTINTILERYRPKVIIWDVNPHSLLNTDNGDEYQNMRYLSYYYDNDKIVREYINNREANMSKYYLLNGYKYNSHFVYTFYPTIHFSSTQQGYIPLLTTETPMIQKKRVEWTGDWVESELLEMYKTIDNCKSKGVDLIIVTSPYYADYDYSAKKICNDFAEMLKKYNTTYINLLYAEPFNSDMVLYRDAAHLNTIGAEIMTDTVANAVYNILNGNH